MKLEYITQDCYYINFALYNSVYSRNLMYVSNYFRIEFEFDFNVKIGESP